MPERIELPLALPMGVARGTKRLVSSVVSGRRNARRPKAFSAWVMHAVSEVLFGMHERTAVACVASANAYCVAAPSAVSYCPTPDGDAVTVEAPTAAKPSTTLS